MGAEMYAVSASVVAFIVALAVIIRVGRFLPAFFFLCYMLPFLPILTAAFGQDSHFWNLDQFVLSADSLQISRLALVWLSSSLGVIAGSALAFIRFQVFDVPGMRKCGEVIDNFPVQPRHLTFNIFVFLLAAVLILARILKGPDIGGDGFFGLENLINNVLLLCWALTICYVRRIYNYGFVLGLTGLYIWSQLATGDRDFFLIIIALAMLVVARGSFSWVAIPVLGMCGVVLVVFGAIISMLRMNVDVSIEELINYVLFNSWNATILPVITMIEEEWDNGIMLFGKTYVDLLLSIIPSPIFHFFNSEKPIHIDNPAYWFYIEGLGGMHASGVALRNFGLTGVFFQSTIFIYALCRLERYCIVRRGVWVSFLYLAVAGALMHAVWYGLISMVNTLVVFFVFRFISRLSLR